MVQVLTRLGVLLVVVCAACSTSTPSDEGRSQPDPTTVEGAPALAEPSTWDGTRRVEVTVMPAVDGTQVEATGNATVPDGALVAWSVIRQPLDLDDCTRHSDGDDPCFDRGTAQVDDQRYAFATHSHLRDGTFEVWVAFQVDLHQAEQPAEVIDLYGERGQHMQGDDITHTGPGGITYFSAQARQSVAV